MIRLLELFDATKFIVQRVNQFIIDFPVFWACQGFVLSVIAICHFFDSYELRTDIFVYFGFRLKKIHISLFSLL